MPYFKLFQVHGLLVRPQYECNEKPLKNGGRTPNARKLYDCGNYTGNPFPLCCRGSVKIKSQLLERRCKFYYLYLLWLEIKVDVNFTMMTYAYRGKSLVAHWQPVRKVAREKFSVALATRKAQCRTVDQDLKNPWRGRGSSHMKQTGMLMHRIS